MRRVVLLFFLLFCAPGFGWHLAGHRQIALAAQEHLPKSLAILKSSASGRALAEAAVLPDLDGLASAGVQRHQERHGHFLSLELLEGKPLPKEFAAFRAQLATMGLHPEKVGSLPYRLHASYERLVLRFARWRQRPDDPVRESAVHHEAGRLAHYAADLMQPLHTTVHHDGIQVKGGTPAKKRRHQGIHAKVDSWIHEVAGNAEPVEAFAVAEVWQEILNAFQSSHALVDATYAQLGQSSKENQIWASKRARGAARFVARLWTTAWVASSEIHLPPWAR